MGFRIGFNLCVLQFFWLRGEPTNRARTSLLDAVLDHDGIGQGIHRRPDHSRSRALQGDGARVVLSADGDPVYRLVQVAVNDLIMLVAIAPIVMFMCGVAPVVVSAKGTPSITEPILTQLLRLPCSRQNGRNGQWLKHPKKQNEHRAQHS